MLVGNRIGHRAGKRPAHLFSRLKVSPYELVFTVGTTKFTLGMMDDGDLGLYYTETEEVIRSWDN